MLLERYIELAKAIKREIEYDELTWSEMRREKDMLLSEISNTEDLTQRDKIQKRIDEIDINVERSKKESLNKVDSLLRNIRQTHPHLSVDQIMAVLKNNFQR